MPPAPPREAAGFLSDPAASGTRPLSPRWLVPRPPCPHVRGPWMPGAARRRGAGLVARPPSAGRDPAPRSACRRVRGSWNQPSLRDERGDDEVAIGLLALAVGLDVAAV